MSVSLASTEGYHQRENIEEERRAGGGREGGRVGDGGGNGERGAQTVKPVVQLSGGREGTEGRKDGSW